MKLIYIANIRFPTEKAHGLQTAKTCEAFSKQDVSIELFVPWRFNAVHADPFEFYGITYPFIVRRIFSIDLFRVNFSFRPIFWIQVTTFSISVLIRLLFSWNKRKIVVYGRDEFTLALLSLFGFKVFYEGHTGSHNIFVRILKHKARGIVCISKGLADFYQSRGCPSDKLCVSPDGVDMSMFEDIVGKKEAMRDELGLPADTKIITYSGSLGLYSWKGVDVFLDAIRPLAEGDMRFMIVGGSPSDIHKLRQKYTDGRILFMGRVSPREVPKYLVASDVLVLPNKTGDIISEKFTSPMKLFEYMASGVPIVASDVPSIAEILDTTNANIFKADDPQSLADAILRFVHNRSNAHRISSKACGDVKMYTWDKRVENLLEFIKDHA